MACDIKDIALAKDSRGEGSGESAGARQQEAPSARTSRPPYAAFVADAHFSCDFCIAVAVPLVMLGSIARSVDPRVGPRLGPEAAAGAPPSGRLCNAHGSSEALDSFPYGASAPIQVLHVTRHLVWYCLVRPARHGDWAGVLLNGLNLAFTATLLVIAVCPRHGRVWAWWRRHRFHVALATVLLARCVLILSTFLLLPPHAWASHAWAGYVISASTSPLVNALALSVYDQLVKLTLRGSIVQAIAQTAAVFVLAYRVAPTIITRQLQLEQQQHCDAAPGDDPAGGGGGGAAVPLRCGSLCPEHSALLSCRPLAQQVLLGLAMVAWPVWLSWAVERRLRRQHAAVCAEWERRRQREQQELEPTDDKKPQQRQQVADPQLGPSSCREETPPDVQRTAGEESTFMERADPPVSATSTAPPAQGVPAAARPSSTSAWAQTGGSTRYRSAMRPAVVSLKVQEHPDSHEEFGSHLASVLYDAVRQEFEVTAEAAAGAGQKSQAAEGEVHRMQRGTATQPVLCTTVIRGCIQVVLWGWVPVGLGGMEESVVAERVLRRLARRLACMGAGGGARGVSLQVGQAVAQLGDLGGGTAEQAVAVRQEQRGQQQRHAAHGAQLEEVLRFHGISTDCSSGAARLLQVEPPAASVAALAASGSLTVRLLLHSPVPQPARVLVLVEGEGLVGVADPGGDHASGSVPWHRTRARLLQAVPAELVGGLQEVELALRAGELEGAVGADGVGALRLLLVGPEHSATEEREGAAAPPLVHWVAPPLLVLPDAAAQELCDLCEGMRREEEAEQAGAGGSAPPTGHPAGAWEALAGSERQSSLWWSHLAPLLGDLAYVLGAGVQRERAEKATSAHPVLEALLPCLREHGMYEVAALVEASCVDSGEPQTQHAKEGASASATPLSATTFSRRTGSTTPATCSASRKPPPNILGASSKAIATPSGGGTASASAAALLPILPGPFYPPRLEAAYQAWRLAGLAGNAPYVLAFRTAAFLMMTTRTVVSTWAPGGVWAGALPWARIGYAGAITVLTTAGDVAGLALLYVLALLRSRRPWRQHGQEQQPHAQQHKGADTEGARPQAGVGAHGAVFSPGDRLLYQLAACVVRPALWLLCAVCVAAGITPVDDLMLSDSRIVYTCSWGRAVIGPCLLQMSAREAMAAAPLLGLAEALMVAGLRPGWGKLRAAAVAVVWQFCAVGVSAVLERRSRRRYLRQRV